MEPNATLPAGFTSDLESAVEACHATKKAVVVLWPDRSTGLALCEHGDAWWFTQDLAKIAPRYWRAAAAGNSNGIQIFYPSDNIPLAWSPALSARRLLTLHEDLRARVIIAP